MNKEIEIVYLGRAPEELLRKSERMRDTRIKNIRERLIKKTNETKFKFYCSLCLIIRDENEYLEEWLRWHIECGVEHFYIYDHGSKEPVTEFIRGLGKEIAKMVTIIDWYGKHKDAQPEAYNDCLNRFRGESRWIGFIDTDEHIRVKTGQLLPELLNDYDEFAGMFAIWVTHGANGQIEQTSGKLRERFTTISHYNRWADCVGKVIVQPMYMEDMVIHNGRTKEGFVMSDEHKRKIYNYSLLSDYPTTDLICVDHYYTKSYEEWVKKLRRGSCHAKFMRKYEEFFCVNPDMEYCRNGNADIYQVYEQFD